MASPPKPCAQCPWTQKGQPDITPELRKKAQTGAWFCCHINMGQCWGARAVGMATLDRAST